MNARTRSEALWRFASTSARIMSAVLAWMTLYMINFGDAQAEPPTAKAVALILLWTCLTTFDLISFIFIEE